MKKLFYVLMLTMVMMAPSYAQSPQQNPITVLTQQLADQRNKLGLCHAELGALEQLQAQVIAGQIQPVEDILKAVVTRFEEANKGKTLNTSTWMVEDKKEK